MRRGKQEGSKGKLAQAEGDGVESKQNRVALNTHSCANRLAGRSERGKRRINVLVYLAQHWRKR
jgi:hypothetical protein